MKHIPVSIFSTRRFSALMEDYVNEKDTLRELYNRSHNRENYAAQIEERSTYEIDRSLLADVLLEQYEGLDIESRYPVVHENVEDLRKPDTYTVVTGHQLCLFTGPLYFIYKIVNTIRLAEELSADRKETVVPVFWMATEDHDFAEVNHIWYNDLKYFWEHPSGDAVGRMRTDGIEEVIDHLSKVLSSSQPVQDLLDLFRRCYRSGQTLSMATRELVTELFGHKGLVILDADDARLKSQAHRVFASELSSNAVSEALEQSSAHLEQNYFAQVNPRDVNLFYLRDEQRYRLTYTDTGDITTVDGPYSKTREEVLAELAEHPERFSPNVILRPVYQEMILPNLAYIGGGGELAYWLQLKPVFDAFQIPFPILRLRNSVGFIRRKFVHKMEKLGLGVDDLVDPLYEQKRSYFREKLALDNDIEKLKEDAEKVFRSMTDLADRIDPTLEGTAKAYNARQLHLLENFEKKILRSQQRRESEVVRMFDEIHGEAFPGGGLQERRETWITLVERFGDGMLEILMDELDPFEHDFSWFLE